MASRTLEFALDHSDWDAYLLAAQMRANEANLRGPRKLTLHLPSVFLTALGAWTVVAALSGGSYKLPLVALLAVLVFLGILRLIGKVAARPADGGIFLGPLRIELGPMGMELTRPNYRSFVNWSPGCSVTRTPAHVFIWLDVFTAQVIPARSLPEGLAPHDLEREIQELIAAHAGQPAAPGAPGAPAGPQVDSDGGVLHSIVRTAPPALPRIRDELLQLLKVLHFGNADVSRMYGRDATIALLGAVAVGLFVGLQRLANTGPAEFMWYAVPGLFWLVAIALAAAWIMARVARPPLPFRQSLLMVAGFSVLAALFLGLGGLWGTRGTLFASFFLLAEALMFFGRGLPMFSGRPQRRAFFAGAALVAGCLWINGQYYWTPSFWYQPEPEPGADAGAMPQWEQEQIAFEQALRVEEAVRSLKRSESPQTQFFFLGFAGYGEQRVFAEEIDTAAARVHARYGTEGRSMRLVNDRRDIQRHPWASASALQASLRGLASVMDVENDVLFLALSSHGSEDGYISVNDGRPFSRDLYVEDLARMLRESGIRWKVIVVSACHSGTFIEPLQDTHTIVITAAAAEKTSFGCSDDRDLTYFGEAFYRDALPTASGLRSAFENARATIRRREIDEGIEESDPQAHFGAEVERKLADLEAASAAD